MVGFPRVDVPQAVDQDLCQSLCILVGVAPLHQMSALYAGQGGCYDPEGREAPAPLASRSSGSLSVYSVLGLFLCLAPKSTFAEVVHHTN